MTVFFRDVPSSSRSNLIFAESSCVPENDSLVVVLTWRLLPTSQVDSTL
ncbi:hypothetical protein [Nannocystis pusilla]